MMERIEKKQRQEEKERKQKERAEKTEEIDILKEKKAAEKLFKQGLVAKRTATEGEAS